MENLIGFVFSSFIVLVIIIVLFAILDWFLKGGNKKAEKKPEVKTEAKPEPTPNPTPVETKQEPKAEPTMKIHNSELADDLNEILKKSQTENSVRLKIESHAHKESNVAKYIKSKNYRSFEFDDAPTSENDTEEPLTFTIDDYKRIMALSNIDDKK